MSESTPKATYDDVVHFLEVREGKWDELRTRLARAARELSTMADDPNRDESEAARLRGKVEGVKLALSYLNETG